MVFILEEEKIEEAPTLETAPTAEKEALRHLARSGARAGETILGLPGDIMSLAKEAPFKTAQLLGVPEETLQRARDISKYIPLPLQDLPTSREIREKITSKIGEGYLEPKTKKEQFADEVLSDAVALAVPLPVKGLKTFPKTTKLLKYLGTSLGANSASELAKSLGASEKTQGALKLGSFMLLGTIGRKNIKDLYKTKFSEADKALKGNPKVNASYLNKYIENTRSKLKKGLESTSEKAVINKLNALQNKIKNGLIEVKELQASKRSLNEEVGKILAEVPTKAAKQRARKLLNEVNFRIGQDLKKYGKRNPKFWKPYSEANEAFKIYNQSNLIGNNISKLSKYSPASPLLYPLMKVLPAPTVATAIGTTGAYKIGQLAYRLTKSPVLRKHYTDLIKASSQENALAITRALKKMDQELLKMGKKENFQNKRFILENS